MKRLAVEIAAAEPRVDVLINNAGAMFSTRHVTEDNLELTFALNHMAYFVLTNGLRDRLMASAPARVVNTASNAHEGRPLDFEDLQLTRAYSEKGAETLVYLASSPQAAGCSGEYFYEYRPTVPSAEALDDGAAALLWTESAKLAGFEM